MLRTLRQLAKPFSLLTLTGFVGQTLLACCIAMGNAAWATSSLKDEHHVVDCHSGVALTQETPPHHDPTLTAHTVDHHDGDTMSLISDDQHCESDESEDCCFLDDESPLALNATRNETKTDTVHSDVLALLSTAPAIQTELKPLDTPPPIGNGRSFRSSPVYLANCAFLE